MAAESAAGGGAFDLPGYDILDVLGYEGFAVIYRARQRSLNRLVAIRTLQGATPGAVTPGLGLEREAAVLARLRHPHVVPVLNRVERGGRT